MMRVFRRWAVFGLAVFGVASPLAARDTEDLYTRWEPAPRAVHWLHAEPFPHAPRLDRHSLRHG